MSLAFVALFITIPALVIYLCYRFAVPRKIGAVLLCYIGGMALGNSGLLPVGFASVQSTMADATVAIALPLLLFSLDVRKWFRVAGKGLLCMGLAAVAIVIVTFALRFVFATGDAESWKLAGLAAGVYTGGTPNLASIKSALQVGNDTYILFHTYDTVISLLYIVFMSSVAKPLLGRFLPAFKHGTGQTAGAEDENESIDAYSGIWKPRVIAGLAAALAVSAAIVGASLFVGELCPQSARTAVTILSITTLGIAASFVKPVRAIKKTFQAGMYVIYVFCFVVASMTRLDSLVHIDWGILGYVTAAIVGSVAVHALLSKLARIDVDTFIITSVSAICSPPFVPVVAAGIKNSAVLVSGITTGIVGYAIGNYLGISLAYLYKSLPF